MNIIRAANELNAAGRKVCLAIGFFDGVHLGHQQIIRQTVADARQQNAISLVITFDQHPSTVVAPSRAPALIYPLAQKLRAIESLGADTLLASSLRKNSFVSSRTMPDAFTACASERTSLSATSVSAMSRCSSNLGRN